MPRRARRRTLTGQEAQPVAVPRGTTYGQGERDMESQRRTPLPDYAASGSQAVPNPGPTTSGGPGSPAPPSEDRLAAAVQAASQMAPPQQLNAPTRRPNEPLTAGMSMGPGPGPEILASGDQVVRTFQTLASITADPSFQRLAELAAQRMY